MKVKNFTTLNARCSFLSKLIILPALFLILQQHAYAQDKGMHFEHGSSWKAILEKAKKENKYIFVDCYTTWCGPCKFMSANIFPKEEVGSFYNQHFINAKFQLDTTAKDAADIKAQYADAAYIRTQFKIKAYPTYLFISPDGELVHRELGSSEAAQFIAKGTNALDPEKQYYTLVKKYDAGNREPAFLKKLALAARDAFEEANASKYAGDFLATRPDLQDKDNLRFIYETTSGTNDPGFVMMISDPAKFETVVDKDELHNALSTIITNSESQKNNHSFDKWDAQHWESYSASLKKQYPAFADKILVRFKTNVHRQKKDWKQFAAVINEYTTKYTMGNTELNDYAWTVFEKCNDKNVLESALKWSKLSFEKETKKEPGFIDTYANLLYKLGNKEEALKWEKQAQAIAIEQGEDKSWGQDVIDKIMKGEKTW